MNYANDAKTFLKHFCDCLFYFCSTCAEFSRVDCIRMSRLHAVQTMTFQYRKYRYVVSFPPPKYRNFWYAGINIIIVPSFHVWYQEVVTFSLKLSLNFFIVKKMWNFHYYLLISNFTFNFKFYYFLLVIDQLKYTTTIFICHSMAGCRRGVSPSKSVPKRNTKLKQIKS